MIRLFISDIDGCLSMPYSPWRLDIISELASLSCEAGPVSDPGILPAITVCSGRSYAYVEAMSQALSLVTPVLFESGAGMFDPVSATTAWHPAFDEEHLERMNAIRSYMAEIIVGTSLSIDHAKRSQAALAGPVPEEIDWARRKMEDYVSARAEGCTTFHTPVSVDVVSSKLSKHAGLRWLASILNLKMESLAFIGDTNGDIDALGVVGRSYAPSNADESVRSTVDVVTREADAAGVLEAYRDCIRRNESLAKRPTV
jgi:hydroxymethylpyrimidine pyrophosphatase-like HAD family hydrolase